MLRELSRGQRAVVVWGAILCAASRFLAMAQSVWEWDEALFTMALRDYDVALHHPHPPGFPVFIGLSHIARLFTGDDFRALQAVSLLAGMLVFPAVFAFARALGLRFSICVTAAVLFAFLPNVWHFGGGAFSDVPSIVLVLFAVAFLLRGARERRSYWVGTLLLALAIGIRPQNFLVGLLPGIRATLKRRPLEILLALLLGVVTVGAAFGTAVHATGSWERYSAAVSDHAEYIARVDSWRSPDRPPLWRLIDRFFLKQYQSPWLSVIATVFVLISITGAIRERSRPLLWNVLAFAPFAIVAWFMLDRFSISRFSIGYQPMFAIFVADGIHRVGSYVAERRPLRTFRDGEPVSASIAAVVIIAFILFTLPALTSVRTDVAPSVAGARAAVQHVDPMREQLLVGHTMSVFLDLVAPSFPYTRVFDDRGMPLGPEGRPVWILAEITETRDEGLVFRRERGTLWNIARHHYFDVKLQPIRDRPRFLSGWYSAESMRDQEWRWMGARSTTLLPPGRGRTMLRLSLSVPRELAPHDPIITVRLNGRTVDEFRPSAGLDRDYRVTAAPHGLPNVLELSTDRTVTPVEGGRELGLRVSGLAWGPA